MCEYEAYLSNSSESAQTRLREKEPKSIFCLKMYDEQRLSLFPIKCCGESGGSPSWCVQVEYTNHTKQDISGYNDYLPEHPEELYFSLSEYFELDGDEL